MNEKNNAKSIDVATEIQDSGWLRFWITFSSVCLILSIFMPDVHMLKNRYLLTWFWEDKVVNSPGYHGIVWVYVLLGMSFLLLVVRSFLQGKFLASVSTFVLILTALVLLTSGIAPKNPGIWSLLSPLWLIMFLVAAGLILSATHLQKLFNNKNFVVLMLVLGGVTLITLLFIAPGPSVLQGAFLGLLSATAWQGQGLIISISVILILLIAIVAILSVTLNTRKGLSIFLRLVFLGIPVLVFFYLYYSSATAAIAVATTSFEAAQQTLWIYGFIMVPASIASIIEWNTLAD
ncbi:hypothetical protein MNBD_GAMMA12-3354 [hydrothermal vent metagenome]|uniref:Uncharacterized protein n=1 Tax=hydrothermal vent metagenome TaxID=652676 RepID=A0A3B0YDM7_9ZZZZ